jgi:hypothetical protein
MKVYGDSSFVILEPDEGYIFVEEESGAGIYTLYLGLYEKPKTYRMIPIEDHYKQENNEPATLEEESIDVSNEEVE